MVTKTERRSVTLRDVANLSGVSTATVARVLHGTGQVSDARRARVEQTVQQTGYQINAVAQGLRKQRTLVIGHVLNSIATNPFFATVAMGVEEAAANHSCGVITVFASEDEETELAAIRFLVQRRVEAIVFTTANHESSIRLAQYAGIPVVQAERAGVPDAYAVTVDNYGGSKEAVQHLIDLGHTRIAYFGVMPPHADTNSFLHRRYKIERERIAGLRDALEENGLEVDESLITLTGQYEDFAHAKATVRQWIVKTPSITAIVAGTDALASAILQELYSHHLRVPDDISLVGFDNTYAAFLTPKLTTVSQPMLELGRASANAAIGLANQPDDLPAEQRRRLATRLVLGDSTGPVEIR